MDDERSRMDLHKHMGTEMHGVGGIIASIMYVKKYCSMRTFLTSLAASVFDVGPHVGALLISYFLSCGRRVWFELPAW